MPRDVSQRVQIGLEHEVAVAALPRRHRVAVHGVHLDIDGEQVVAPLGTVLDDLVDEVPGGQSLALQPALHVCEGDDDRVDGAGIDRALQLVDLERGLHLCHGASSGGSHRAAPRGSADGDTIAAMESP